MRTRLHKANKILSVDPHIIGDVFIERRDEIFVESEFASPHHDGLSYADRLQQP